MSQAYGKTPSELYGIEGAVGFCFDTGIFLFASWVESECQEAERRASNEMFARSNRARAFARCMGDDMESSAAGFADPFKTGALESDDDPFAGANQRMAADGGRRRRYQGEKDYAEELLWSESDGEARDFENV